MSVILITRCGAARNNNKKQWEKTCLYIQGCEESNRRGKNFTDEEGSIAWLFYH